VFCFEGFSFFVHKLNPAADNRKIYQEFVPNFKSSLKITDKKYLIYLNKQHPHRKTDAA